MEKIIRTPEEIRRKIEDWLTRYNHKEAEAFDGKEEFTLFSKLGEETSSMLAEAITLGENELPVLVLVVGGYGYIVNTTERFIRITGTAVESLPYSDFEAHLGFVSIREMDLARGKSLKTAGGFQEFGIKTKSGKTLNWILPTGEPGVAFWNVTKKCEIIGRRFLIQ